MRNLKKLLAVILSVVMIASMMVPALAANTYEAEALKLQAINVFAGGPEDLKLDEGVTRIQGLTFAIRAAGKDADALAMEDEEVDTILADWTDADSIPQWGRKYAAYAIKNSITVGLSATEKIFGALNPISGTSFLVFIMKAGMGYADVTTADVIDAAVEAGILSAGQAIEFGQKEALIRDDAAGILYGAFTTGVNADGTKLIDAYIASGATTLEDAIEAGFAEEEVPEELEVVSVTANNLRQIEVRFNKEVDEDTIKDANFNVSDFTGEKASLEDDGVTVIVTLQGTDKFVNEEDYSIEISNVEDLNGNAIEDVEKDFTVQDYALPVLEDIEFTGPQTAKLTFSEPIESGGEVTIDNGVYSATVQKISGNTVEVDLGTELDEGVHEFKVKGFADFVPYTMISKTLDVTYVDIDDAPEVSIKEASQTEVTLSFNRPVKGLEESSFYHTYSSWKPLAIEDKDGKAVDPNDYYDEVTLIFTDSSDAKNNLPLPEGSVKVFILAESDSYKIEDRWENKLDDDVILYANISADDEAPYVTDIEVEDDQKTVKLFLNEKVNLGAVKADKVSIVDEDGDEVKTYHYTRIVKVDGDDYYLEIKFKDDQEGAFKITIKGGIKDTSLSENEIEKVTLSFDIENTKGISLKNDVTVTCVDADDIIYIDYGVAMAKTGTYSVLNLKNYQLNGADIKKDDVTISMFTSKIVKIEYKKAKSLVGSDLTIARVEDAKGNLTKELSYTFSNIQEEAGPKVKEIKKVADNKLEIKIDKELKSVKTAGVTVDGNLDGTATQVANISFKNDGDSTIIFVTLVAGEKDEGTAPLADGFTVNIVKDNIKSVTGAYMADATFVVGEVSTITWKDGTAPEIATIDKDEKIYVSKEKLTTAGALIAEITIEYTEKIKSNTVSKYTYQVGGYSVDDVRVEDNKVILVVSNDDDDEDNDIEEKPTVTQVYNIEDLAGNRFLSDDAIEAFSYGEAASKGLLD